MTSTKNSEKFSIAAAVCFILIAVGVVVYNILQPAAKEVSFVDFLEPTIAIGFALTLLFKNKLAVTVVAVINVLFHSFCGGSPASYHLRSSLDGFLLGQLYFPLDYLDDTLWFLACVAIVVILVLTLKKNRLTRKIWFVGGTLLFISFVWKICDYGIYRLNWGKMLLLLGYVVAFLFIGLWLRGSDFPIESLPANINSKSNPQSDNTIVYNKTINSSTQNTEMQRLKQIKNLLDSGIITQEEYDAKKKEILGL